LTRGKPNHIVGEEVEVVRDFTCIHGVDPLRSALLDGFDIVNHVKEVGLTISSAARQMARILRTQNA
jgi:hypothetical protein